MHHISVDLIILNFQMTLSLQIKMCRMTFFKGIISLIIFIKFLHNGFLNRTRIAEDFQQRIDVHSKAIMCATIWDGTALEQRIVCEHHAFNQYCELKFDGLLANNSKLDAVCTEGRLMTLLYQS